MAEHDHSYRQLFSHPELVRDLLLGFVREDWIRSLDLDTLERVNGSYISDDLREREDDIIWRVRLGGSWVYVYLLIEFQSTVDRYMAVRLLTYVGLLYQDLIKGGQVEEGGLLPPVMPIVLYNGRREWNAPVSIGTLIQEVPGGLGRYQPDFRYLLIEEQGYNEDDMPARNLVSAIFRLEQSQYPEDVRAVVDALVEWLKSPAQASIRRAFTVWINRVLLPVRLKGQELPTTNDLMEVQNMLAERVKEWTKEWKAQGIEEGLKQGMQQGLQQGMQQGLQQGIRDIIVETVDARFGGVPLRFRERIGLVSDTEKLKAIHRRLLQIESLEELENDPVWN